MLSSGQTTMTTIQYQGRQARRSGSEQRRVAILEAALRIVVQEGIRNVRHRAVAKEAEVPLSATTYYFKDISDLICDAFTLFAENAVENVIDPFKRQVFALLDSVDQGLPEDVEARGKIIGTLSDMVTAFLVAEVRDNREHLIAEQAFLQEATMDARLEQLAGHYLEQQKQVMLEACRKLGSINEELDAELAMANIFAIERQLLLLKEPSVDYIRPRVEHMIRLISGTRA